MNKLLLGLFFITTHLFSIKNIDLQKANAEVLMLAIHNEDLNEIESFAKRSKGSFNPNFRINGISPFHLAASKGNIHIVKALRKIPNIDSGITCDNIELYGKLHNHVTAVSIAIANKNFEIAKELIDISKCNTKMAQKEVTDYELNLDDGNFDALEKAIIESFNKESKDKNFLDEK